MRKRKSLVRIALSRILGLIIFLLTLFVLNMLTFAIKFQLLDKIVHFLNANFLLIILMSIVLGMGEFFGAMKFPLNLPAPLVNACGAVLLTVFIFRLIFFSGNLLDFDFLGIIRFLSYLIYPMVFMLVLVFGYIMIFFKKN